MGFISANKSSICSEVTDSWFIQQNMTISGVGVTKPFFFRSVIFPLFLEWSKHWLIVWYHVHIWKVSPQLRRHPTYMNITENIQSILLLNQSFPSLTINERSFTSPISVLGWAIEMMCQMHVLLLTQSHPAAANPHSIVGWKLLIALYCMELLLPPHSKESPERSDWIRRQLSLYFANLALSWRVLWCHLH